MRSCPKCGSAKNITVDWVAMADWDVNSLHCLSCDHRWSTPYYENPFGNDDGPEMSDPPGRPIQRETVEEALENDRCGICLSVDHFREDCPKMSDPPGRPES